MKTKSLLLAFAVGAFLFGGLTKTNDNLNVAFATESNVINFNFYDEANLTSTGGEGFTYENALNFMTLSDTTLDKASVLKSIDTTNTVQTAKNGGLTFGSSKKNGNATFSFSAQFQITNVKLVGAKYDNSDIVIFDGSMTFPSTGALNEKHTKLADCTNTKEWDLSAAPVSTFKIGTLSKRSTIYTMELTYTVKDNAKDIVAVETFVNDFMHPEIATDNNTDTDACLGADGYYAKAKVAFNNLTVEQRKLFIEDASFVDMYARLSAWARANGETFDASNSLVNASNFNMSTFESNSYVIIISLIGILSISTISLIVIIKRKKATK